MDDHETEGDELDPRVVDLVGSRFKLGPSIGQGAFGRVVQAYDTRLQRDVAIKFIEAPSGGSANTARLLREARAASVAGHAGVTVFDVLSGENRVAIVMELVRRGSMIRVIRAGTASSVGTTLGLAAVRSMAHVHRAGIVHLDLHPGNLLVHDDDSVAVGDFGLAKFARRAGLSRGGHEINWTAPELLDFGVASPQADVYALGQVLRWIARRAGSDFGPAVQRATDEDPAQRQPNAAALLGDLTR